MKNPWLAAVLNIVSGLGYIYLNPKRGFGWLILVSTVLIFSTFFDTSAAAQAYSDAPGTIWDFLSFLGGIVLLIAFVVDGYAEAVRLNHLQKKKV
ncbi:hypothetical protein BH09PAT4_BH09PAT4_05490 [soil metagenome]